MSLRLRNVCNNMLPWVPYIAAWKDGDGKPATTIPVYAKNVCGRQLASPRSTVCLAGH